MKKEDNVTQTTNIQNRKTIFRLAPCPSYDMAGIESWLSDLAQGGLILKQFGVHFGLFSFAKGAPQLLTYRLEVADQKGFFDNTDNRPSDNKLALYAELGWEYVARYQNFSIYASAEGAPRELNTDPTLHALTLNALKKQQLTVTLLSLLQLFFFFWVLSEDFWQTILIFGSVLSLVASMAYLSVLFGNVAEIVHLAKLRKTLIKQGKLPHRKAWRAQQKQHFLCVFIALGLWLAFAVLFCLRWQVDSAESQVYTLTEYGQAPPFATLVDFVGEDGYDSYTPNDAFDGANSIEVWQDPLAPQNIDWLEIATLSKENTIVLDAYYSVEYHQMANTWLARQLAKEYAANLENSFSYAEPLILTDLPAVDYCAAALLRFGASFVIQQGDEVLYVVVLDYADYSDSEALPLETYATQLIEQLNDKG